MLFNIFSKLFKRKLITFVIFTLVIGGGYFGYKYFKGEGGPIRYVTAQVERSTIVSSVSGSGQVSVSDQIEVKAKSSGEVTAIYIIEGQEVEVGQLLLRLDTKEAERAIRDAEISLENARLQLEELLAGADAKSLLQAENALHQAERDLEKAKENYDQITLDAEQDFISAYEDSYSAVSNVFLDLPDYMEDLSDVLGTEQSAEANIGSYELILGKDSPFIQKLLTDYYRANDLFNENFSFFRIVSRDSDRETLYLLLSDTFETTKAISQALESARHMFDAIVTNSYSYKNFYIASTIDRMKPKIVAGIPSVNSSISSLQRVKDTIDDSNKNTPTKLKDAEEAIKAAEEKLKEKKIALEELKAGPDAFNIKPQQNTVAQKEEALLEAREKLANCSVYSPLGGIVAEVNVKQGDSASQSTVLSIIITKQKIAEITLNEVDVAKVQIGQPATLTLDALESLTFTGKVAEIASMGSINQGVVTYGIKIAFDTQDERIKPGMSVTADIITDSKQDVLVLPNSAVKFQGDSYYVELVEATEEMRSQLLANVSGGITLPNPPKRQIVETGISNDLSTEVIGGLKEGDIVVTSTVNPNQAQTTQSTQIQSGGFQMPGMSGQGQQMRMNFR